MSIEMYRAISNMAKSEGASSKKKGPQLAGVGDRKVINGEEYESLGSYRVYPDDKKGNYVTPTPEDMSEEEFNTPYRHIDYHHEERRNPDGTKSIEKWKKVARPMS